MVKHQHSRIYILKWVAGLVLAMGIALGGATLYLGSRWRPVLDAQLKQSVLKATDSLYRVEYTQLKVSLLSGNSVIRNFRLIPNKAVYKRLLRAGKAPDNLYDLSVDKLVLNRFHPVKLYRDRKLRIDAIVINKPKLRVLNRRQAYNKTFMATAKTPYKMISEFVSELSVGQIALNDIDFSFVNQNRRQVVTTSVKNLNIFIDDFFIDSVSRKDKNRFYHTRNIQVTLNNYKLATPDSLYYLAMSDFNFSAAGRKLVLYGLKLVPRFNSADFYKRVNYAKSRFSLRFDEVAINAIDLENFIKDQRLHARSMDVNTGSIAVMNNNAYLKQAVPRFEKFPQRQLKNLGLDLRIDSVHLRNINISYAEHDGVTRRTGTVVFGQTTGTISNVTTNAAALKKNHYSRAQLSTRLMNSGRLDTRFNFDLTDPAGAFTCSGILGSMNGKLINQISRPLSMVEVRTGKIDKLIFALKADKNVASGTMQFHYHDLKVQILKHNEKWGTLHNQGIISGLANTFVIEEDNPRTGDKLVEANIYYERPADVSFFTYLWRSLFTGIKESVGVGPEREMRIRGTVEKYEDMLGRMKAKGAGRKEERQKRRTDRREKREEREAKKRLEKRK